VGYPAPGHQPAKTRFLKFLSLTFGPADRILSAPGDSNADRIALLGHSFCAAFVILVRYPGTGLLAGTSLLFTPQMPGPLRHSYILKSLR
jgi:hypothetical protein